MPDLPSNPVARKINGEAVVLLGWGRAILLQLAHPLVAAGVGDYSTFGTGAHGYLRRARQTVGAMLDLTFGAPEDARRIVDHINRIHDRVNGRLRETVGVFQAGTPYSARDPRLLCWVHATLIESMVQAYELFVGPLSTDEKDRYAIEAAWLAQELGVERDRLPDSYAAVEAYLGERLASGEICVGVDARRLAGVLLASPLGPATAPVFHVSRLITIGLLPPSIRDGYGFAWDARRERTFRRTLALIRGTRRLLPPVLREWPAARAA
jgi:uncharacterized protein (DUF2236 family)